MWDWNANGVKREWLEAILEKIKECPQHTFQILSKRPKRYSRLTYPDNAWIGTSVATNADLYRIHDLASAIKSSNIRFFSIEPIHEKIEFWFTKETVDWIIIGAETGHRRGKITPEPEWVSSLIKNGSEEDIPVFIKNNVGWSETIRAFPGLPYKSVQNLTSQKY
jgi:protein gp37